MKLRAAAAVMLLLLACAAARAQDKPVEFIDDPVGIRFVPPNGAERLGDEAARVYGAGTLFNAVFSYQKNTMILIINTFDAETGGFPAGSTNDDHQALRQKFESEITAGFPDVKWMSRDVIKINGPPWVRLRYKAASGGGEVVSDMYAIVWAGRLVVFNYICSAGNYERLQTDVEKSAASIQLFLRFPLESKPTVLRGKRKRKP
jgi:hypothetical protein